MRNDDDRSFGGDGLIDAKKVKLMTRLAIYDQTQGKKDRHMHRCSRSVYMGIRRGIHFIALTIIFCLAAGLYCFQYVDEIFRQGFAYDYKPLLIRLLVAYILTLAIGLLIMERKCKKRYDEMIRHLEKYDYDLYYLEKYIRSQEAGQ